jgi:hypothetical protein
MKRTEMFLCTLAICLAAAPAFAVNTAKVYKSGPLVLIFLGFFALLIVVQLLPALSTLIGMLKGVFSSKGTPPEAAVSKQGAKRS